MIPTATTKDDFDFRDIESLLCHPLVLADLIEACLNHQNPQALAEIVLQDAPLSARVLLAARKSGTAFDPAEPVSSAVQSLGIPALTCLSLQASQQLLSLTLSDEELVFQYRLWSASQVGATVARCLAPSVNFPRIEEAQLCGLLLNLGIHLLFGRFGRDYLVLNVGAHSRTSQALLEKGRFGIDHLQLADQLISQWHLGSFLADAIRFLHADIRQVEQSGPLLKIARLAQQFCQSPKELSTECQQLAERLFGLRESEISYLFQWANGLYAATLDDSDDPQMVRNDFRDALVRLTDLSYLLANQEAVRARLAEAPGQSRLLALIRQLYLEQSPAREVFVFLLDSKRNLLTGMPIEGQDPLVADLEVPLLQGCSVLSRAVAEHSLTSTYSAEETLTVTDHLLLRLCRGTGFACLPLYSAEQPLGALVLEIDNAESLPLCESLKVAMLGHSVSAALVREPEMSLETGSEGSGLLRRVSHEVKNPLTVINNYIEVLSRSDQNAEHVSITGAIKNEVKRIDTILNYYLNQQDEAEFFDPAIDLNQLVRETVRSLQDSDLDLGNISLNLNLQDGLGRVQGSGMLMKQILINLIKNAVESFADKGTVDIATRLVFVGSRGWQVEILVRDDGPGLPDQVLKHLFKPVASTKGAGYAGVGLSIVKSMVEDLNGQISCYTSADKGTSFCIQIPYQQI